MRFYDLYTGEKLNTGNLIAAFDFSPPLVLGEYLTNQIINNISGLIHSYSDNFYNKSGSGYFADGRYVEILNSSGYNNFTAFVSFEREIGGNCILLSTHQFGNPISGFTFGINDANRAFIHIEQSGINEIFTFNELPLATKNCLALNLSNSAVTLNICDLAYSSLYSQSYIFRTDANFNSDKFYIASNSGYQDRYDLNNYKFNDFSGYVDNFILMRNALSKTAIIRLARSFVPGFTGESGTVLSTGYVPSLLDYSMNGVSLNKNYTGDIPTNLVSNFAEFYNTSGIGIEPIFTRSLLGFKTRGYHSGIDLYISGQHIDSGLYILNGNRIQFLDNRRFDENTPAVYDILPINFSNSFTGQNSLSLSGDYLRKDISVLIDGSRIENNQFVETSFLDKLFGKERIFFTGANNLYLDSNENWVFTLDMLNNDIEDFSGNSYNTFEDEIMEVLI